MLKSNNSNVKYLQYLICQRSEKIHVQYKRPTMRFAQMLLVHSATYKTKQYDFAFFF